MYADGTTVRTITYDDGTPPLVTVTPPQGGSEANRQAMVAKIGTALAVNAADLAADQAIITQATALADTTGSRTLAQLSGDVRALAQAVKILAGNDVNSKRELTAMIRLRLGNDALDNTTGT